MTSRDLVIGAVRELIADDPQFYVGLIGKVVERTGLPKDVVIQLFKDFRKDPPFKDITGGANADYPGNAE